MNTIYRAKGLGLRLRAHEKVQQESGGLMLEEWPSFGIGTQAFGFRVYITLSLKP